MDNTEPPIGLRDRHSRDVVLSVEARALEKQRKEAVVTMVQPEGGAFTIASDEGAYLEAATRRHRRSRTSARRSRPDCSRNVERSIGLDGRVLRNEAG